MRISATTENDIRGHILAAQHKVDLLEGLIQNGLGYSGDNLRKQLALAANALANHATAIRALCEAGAGGDWIE